VGGVGGSADAGAVLTEDDAQPRAGDQRFAEPGLYRAPSKLIRVELDHCAMLTHPLGRDA